MGDQTEIPGTSGMSTVSRKTHQVSNVESELYLLIAKFLSTGVCQRAAEVLKNEIEEHQLLPKRVDWLGGRHSRNFSEIEHLLSQVSDDHLLKICLRIGPIIDKEIPPTVPGLQSLLGVGKQSLLRIKEDLGKAKVSHDYLVSRKYGVPFFPSPAIQASYPPSITKVLLAREFSGPVSCRHIFPSKTYARLQHFRRFLGHLSSVYCVLFDRTGKYIFTGADDLLVKIWSAIDGRLLASLRGHSAEITDMTVNYENTLLAAGSCDKTIRVWCVRTCAPVAVLCGHTAMVTSIQFCPYPKGDENYLVSTGNDGCICFWQWSPKNNSFNPKPLKFTERSRAGAQMICSSFSQGGVFLATGSTDHNVRVYNIAGSLVPEKILERALHTDRVDSIQFSNRDCRFISGSKDGTAQIWRYERQSWHNVTLKMATKLPGSQTEEVEDSKLKLRVTMVGWTLDDGMVITAVSDHSVKVWDSIKGNLCHILKGHGDEVFVLESHPLDPRVLLSSGHDGRINLWDLNTGTVIKSHFNLIEGQGHGAVFDCKFSPDGQMFAATDSHGHLSIYGLGSVDRFKKIPEEQFFHTDYRPLIRDINHHVLDEQTQTPPHLLPPPFLVDIDGNPYPPNLQRLVPGRENCNDSQLIPYIAVSAEGEAEILEPVRPPEDRPTIDDMIERLQQEQEGQHPLSPNRNAENDNDFNDHMVSPRSGQRSPRVPNNERNGPSDAYSPRSTQRAQAGHSRVGMRRTGDIEGVRQSVGNWQSRGNQVEVPSWVKRVIVKPMSATLASSNLERRMIIAEKELTYYNTQKVRRPNTDTSEVTPRKIDDRKRQRQRFSLRTRGAGNSMYEDFETNNFREDQPSSSSSETETEQKTIWDDSSGAEESAGSGEDSDWIADAGVNVERTNARAKPSSSVAGGGTASRPRRYVFSEEEDDENTEEEKEEEEDEYDKAGTSTREKVKPRSKKLMTKEKQETKAQKARKKPLGKKVPERYRPPEWLTDVMPHKVPYVPQVGDEVVYFRQGHELYVQAVKRNRLYEIFMRNQPWRQLKQLREQEVARIIQMSFENHIPRLCCLKLKLLNPVDEDENVFTVKYHDMPDVIDFLVLKQNYDQAMAHNWKPGDRFRSAIDKAWWLGTIKVQKPFNDNYPDSPFQCYIVKWDNGERECMSPWDFEPIDPERMPDEVGGSVDITPDERQAMMYSPERFEWSSFGQDYDIDRILRGLNIISELSIAEPFVAPVDLVRYPSYAMHVAYPMDLGTIKTRLQNRYYRRLDAVKFDMEYIKLNAERFNESGSRIVKQAKCLVELCMKFFSSVGCEDPMDFYNEMLEAKRSRSQDSQSELDVICSESDRDKEYTMSTRLKRKKRRESIIQSNKRLKLDSPQYTSESWKVQCSSLLDEIFQLDDSTPFRRPVSMQEYPDYRNIIDCPMDLSTVKEKLETNLYSNPIEFCKDMRLIFQNSRNYNTNKKSKIYSMTIRLSASFEEQFRKIASDWKSVVKYEEKLQNNQFVSNRRKPFSIVNSDVNSFSRRSNHHNGTNHKNNEIYQPGPSRRSIAANSAKYEEPCSSRSARRPRRDDRHRSSSSSKVVPARNKINHLRFKIRNAMTNGIVKNSKIKSVKMKAEKRPVVKKAVKQEKIENTESDEDDSDKADSESEASSSFDDDEECEEERKMRRRKVPPNAEVQRKLRPRSRNIRRSNRNTRSASQQLQESLTISNPFRNPRFKNLRSRTSPPCSPMRSRTRPTIHRLTSLRTHRMELHPSTTASRLSTLRSKRTISRPSIRSSAGSDSNESDQTSKSKANSNSTNSSKSASDSSEESRSSSQNMNSRGSSANEHSNNKEHSESDSESPELNPATDPRMRRSTRATTRDSTKATSSALLDSKPNKRKKLSPKILTRNRGQRTVRYMEESDDDDDNYNYQNTDDENSQTISISSRGRLRKLIKHGKRLFSE